MFEEHFLRHSGSKAHTYEKIPRGKKHSLLFTRGFCKAWEYQNSSINHLTADSLLSMMFAENLLKLDSDNLASFGNNLWRYEARLGASRSVEVSMTWKRSVRRSKKLRRLQVSSSHYYARRCGNKNAKDCCKRFVKTASDFWTHVKTATEK